MTLWWAELPHLHWVAVTGKLVLVIIVGWVTVGRVTVGRVTVGRVTAGWFTAGWVTVGWVTVGRVTVGRVTVGCGNDDCAWLENIKFWFSDWFV